jgi:hypothetical protein
VRIYLDTVLWNKLCDERADAPKLIAALSTRNKQLVVGTEAIYEMAKTFKGNPDRGKELFASLKTFTDLGIPCPRPNPNILRSEAELAFSGDRQQVNIFLNPEDYQNMQEEVDKLSRGILDQRAEQFIESRKQLAAISRAAMSAHYQIPSTLKVRLSGISVPDLEKWLRKEVARSGRRILKEHFKELLPDLQPRRLTIIAKKLLSSPRFLLSHAVVRADLYTNWRTADTESMPRDLLPDLDHVVTASYFDVYATMEAGQSKYASLILKQTSIAIYDGKLPLSEWLESL